MKQPQPSYIMDFLFSTYFFLFVIIILIGLLIFNKNFRVLFYKPEPCPKTPISKEYFFESFEKSMKDLSNEDKSNRWKELIEKAWNIRSFEIELYWKRTNYFWLFQTASFTGYFLIIKQIDNLEKSFAIICLGIIFSIGWILINKGSKQWQGHWEAYIDMLEDKYYGPLYKTVGMQTTYSVSKINELISIAVLGLWSLFLMNLFQSNDIYLAFFNPKKFNASFSYTSLATILMIFSLLKGYGKGFIIGNREIVFYNREVQYK